MWPWTTYILASIWLLGASGFPLAHAENRALFIGINNYTHVTRPLYGAVNDARQMQQFAQRLWGYRPEQTRLLLEQDASRDGILTAIHTWLIAGTVAGDQVLLYYAGHGFYTRDVSGDEEDGFDETLVSADTYMDAAGMVHNMVLDDEIQTLLDQIDDRLVMVIIDSCHSGTVTRAVAFDACRAARGKRRPALGCRITEETVLSRAFTPRQRREASFVPSTARRVVWSAVSSAQEAIEDNEDATGSGGVFTRRFIVGVEQGLADANHNGQVTYTELHDYVLRESERYCQQHTLNCPLGLTPTLEAPPDILPHSVQHRPSSQVPTTVPVAQVAAEVLAHDEGMQVQVEVLPGPRVRLGTVVQFRITSPVDGYLLVLDTTPANELVQLFPGARVGTNNRIRARRPVLLPGVFKATDPGPGVLFAVVAEDKVAFPTARDVQVVPNPTQTVQVIPNPWSFLARLGIPLRQTWKDDSINRRPRWVLGKAEYQITP